MGLGNILHVEKYKIIPYNKSHEISWERAFYALFYDNDTVQGR